MQINIKHARLASVSIAFLSVSAAFVGSSPAAAGPLSVAPRADIAPAAATQQVQYRRGARASRVGVRHRAVRYGRPHYSSRYAYRRAYVNPLFPVAAVGLFAGALGAAIAGPSSYYCDPAYYTWNYGGCYNRGYPAYSSGYHPAYGGGYYPAYAGGYYPAYRAPRVIYTSRYQRPRTVRYRAVAPGRHYVGSRTHVRSGYRAQRVRR